MGEPAPRLIARRGLRRRCRTRTAPTSSDAQPVSRLGPLHDARRGGGVTAPDASSERALAALVADEAMLLDAGRFDDWLALWHDEARYWVPLRRRRAARRRARPQSLADEDREAAAAARRAPAPPARAFAEAAAVACQHVLQLSRVEHPRRRRFGDPLAHAVPLCRGAGRARADARRPRAPPPRCARQLAGRSARSASTFSDASRPLPAVQLFV